MRSARPFDVACPLVLGIRHAGSRRSRLRSQRSLHHGCPLALHTSHHHGLLFQDFDAPSCPASPRPHRHLGPHGLPVGMELHALCRLSRRLKAGETHSLRSRKRANEPANTTFFNAICPIWRCRYARFVYSFKVKGKRIGVVVGADARAVRPYILCNNQLIYPFTCQLSTELIINHLHLAFQSQPFWRAISAILPPNMAHFTAQYGWN